MISLQSNESFLLSLNKIKTKINILVGLMVCLAIYAIQANAESAISTTSATDATPTNFIAAGTYTSFTFSGYKQKPFMLSSIDGGKQWQFNQAITFPEKVEGEFNGVICPQQHDCIAFGEYAGYDDERYTAFPLLYHSYNLGKSWELQQLYIHNYPSYLLQTKMSAVDCDGTHCVAVGESVQTNNKIFSRPLILHSADLGNTWTFNWAIQGLDNMPVASVKDVACRNQQCNAVGTYFSDADQRWQALIIHSWDQGETWEKVDLSNRLPTGIGLPRFTKIKCGDHFCVTAGGAENKQATNNLLLLRSEDGGTQWLPVQLQDFPTDFTNAYVNAVYAKGQKAYIVGDYMPVKADYSRPFLLISDNEGKTWRYSSVEKSDNTFINGKLNDIDCSDQYCIAVGERSFKNETFPFSVYSDNAGASWTIRNTIKDFPKDFINGSAILFSVKCLNHRCVSVGEVIDNGYRKKPLLLTSDDNGLNWQYAGNKVSQMPLIRSAVSMTAVSSAGSSH